jgi:hypothetical protein
LNDGVALKQAKSILGLYVSKPWAATIFFLTPSDTDQKKGELELVPEFLDGSKFLSLFGWSFINTINIFMTIRTKSIDRLCFILQRFEKILISKITFCPKLILSWSTKFATSNFL